MMTSNLRLFTIYNSYIPVKISTLTFDHTNRKIGGGGGGVVEQKVEEVGDMRR